VRSTDWQHAANVALVLSAAGGRQDHEAQCQLQRAMCECDDLIKPMMPGAYTCQERSNRHLQDSALQDTSLQDSALQDTSHFTRRWAVSRTSIGKVAAAVLQSCSIINAMEHFKINANNAKYHLFMCSQGCHRQLLQFELVLSSQGWQAAAVGCCRARP
jgi:hypothetical protein